MLELPVRGLLPVQPPDAVQEVALLVDQVRVLLPPLAMDAGVALSVTVGIGVGVVTVTVVLARAMRPKRAQVRV